MHWKEDYNLIYHGIWYALIRLIQQGQNSFNCGLKVLTIVITITLRNRVVQYNMKQNKNCSDDLQISDDRDLVKTTR